MPIFEIGKAFVEKLTGWARPAREDVEKAISKNHPAWPLILYKSPLRLPPTFDPAAMFEELFASNKWGGSWRNGVYPYVHYHSQIHEVLGVASGQATIQFGGNNGRSNKLRAGDVAILPAGTGHKCVTSSPDFLVVGAYPPEGVYDLCRSSEDHADAVKNIPRVPKPESDPVYGKDGPLLRIWG